MNWLTQITDCLICDFLRIIDFYSGFTECRLHVTVLSKVVSSQYSGSLFSVINRVSGIAWLSLCIGYQARIQSTGSLLSVTIVLFYCIKVVYFENKEIFQFYLMYTYSNHTTFVILIYRISSVSHHHWLTKQMIIYCLYAM